MRKSPFFILFWLIFLVSHQIFAETSEDLLLKMDIDKIKIHKGDYFKIALTLLNQGAKPLRVLSYPWVNDADYFELSNADGERLECYIDSILEPRHVRESDLIILEPGQEYKKIFKAKVKKTKMGRFNEKKVKGNFLVFDEELGGGIGLLLPSYGKYKIRASWSVTPSNLKYRSFKSLPKNIWYGTSKSSTLEFEFGK